MLWITGVRLTELYQKANAGEEVKLSSKELAELVEVYNGAKQSKVGQEFIDRTAIEIYSEQMFPDDPDSAFEYAAKLWEARERFIRKGLSK